MNHFNIYTFLKHRNGSERTIEKDFQRPGHNSTAIMCTYALLQNKSFRAQCMWIGAREET